ncbi:MAG: hypothetical protein AB1611_05765 [bacterium]
MKNTTGKPYILFTAIIIAAVSFTLLSSFTRAAQDDDNESTDSTKLEPKWYKWVGINSPFTGAQSFPVGGTTAIPGTNPPLYSGMSIATIPVLYSTYGPAPMNYSSLGSTAGVTGSYYMPKQAAGNWGTGGVSYYGMASSYYGTSSGTGAGGFFSSPLYGSTMGTLSYNPVGMSTGYVGYTGAGSMSPVYSMGGIPSSGLPAGYGYGMGSMGAAYGMGTGLPAGYGYGLGSPVYGSAGLSARPSYGGAGYGSGHRGGGMMIP